MWSSLKNNPNNLDLSYERDLDFLDCSGTENPILQQTYQAKLRTYGVIPEGNLSLSLSLSVCVCVCVCVF